MSEAEAFHQLLGLLAGENDGSNWSSPEFPAIDRLRRAIAAPAVKASIADLAILIRQALVFESTRRNWEPLAECEVRGGRWLAFEGWNAFGLNAVAVAGGWRLSVLPWRPSWLSTEGVHSLEAWASSEHICRDFNTAAVKGDPFLSRLSRPNYRSAAQRDAVRAALLAPPGSTLVVTLATGEGKSLIAHAVAAVGYGNASHQGHSLGVTLVMVPTVALALDQESGAQAAGFTAPLAYRSGNQENNRQIAEAIAAGSQRLCYASPEAICGALREPLKTASAAGLLNAIVIDEAHLVDSWGTGFRTEFQLLAGLRRELISLSPEKRQPRTILLSATLTASATDTLRTLFGSPGEFSELAAASLRPEPEFWLASPASEVERGRRVAEALHRVPRPAILYVTRVNDAEVWYQQVIEMGFRRARLITGRTCLEERDVILKEWRAGDIDLVIATSAFGMGIDYPHVRSVIHACVPESLDRFYQEVGRGGRDGRACLSLLLPAQEDWPIARRLSEVSVIGIERGFQRWSAMFKSAEHVPDSLLFHVRLDTSPGVEDEDIDMVGERSADWNARTLTLMERAGLIRQCGIGRRHESLEPWQTVEIIDPDHMDISAWRDSVDLERRAIAAASSANYELMRQYIDRQSCIANLLGQLYGQGCVSAGCTSCSLCRTNPVSRIRPATLSYKYPWRKSLTLNSPLLDLLDSSYRLLVYFDQGNCDSRWFRRMGEILGALGVSGVHNLILLSNASEFDDRITKNLAQNSWFVAHVNRLLPGHLPPGPEVILSNEKLSLSRANLSRRDNGSARIFILPADTKAPDRPEVLLTNCFDGRIFSFDEFHQRMTR